METHLIAEFDPFGREPVLRKMPDGTLVCLFLTGGPTEPHNENVAMISRSFDDGETWTEPATLFSHPCRGVRCTELFTEGPVPMAFVHTCNAESHYRELQTYISFSPDNGRTWTPPRSLPGGLTGASFRQGVVLSSGEWLFPVHWQESRYSCEWVPGADDEKHSEFVCGVAMTGDMGRSWQRFGDIRAETGLWEPGCVELEEGHLVMLMRDAAGHRLQVSESFNYGRSWSEPHPTVIPNPGTKPTLLKARGSILLVNNFVDGDSCSDRTHLGVWVSNDMMRSWKKYPLKEEDGFWFYPHGFADEEEETVYLAVENGRRHELLKIPFEELGI